MHFRYSCHDFAFCLFSFIIFCVTLFFAPSVLVFGFSLVPSPRSFIFLFISTSCLFRFHLTRRLFPHFHFHTYICFSFLFFVLFQLFHVYIFLSLFGGRWWSCNFLPPTPLCSSSSSSSSPFLSFYSLVISVFLSPFPSLYPLRPVFPSGPSARILLRRMKHRRIAARTPSPCL